MSGNRLQGALRSSRPKPGLTNGFTLPAAAPAGGPFPIASGGLRDASELSDHASGDGISGKALGVELFDGSDDAIACAIGLGCGGLGEVTGGELLEGVALRAGGGDA